MDSLVSRKQQISLRHSILFFDDDILYNEILLLIIFNDRKRRLCFQKRLSVILSMGGGWTDPPGCRHGGSAQPPGYRHPFPLRQTSVGASSCHDSLIFMSTHKATAARCLSRHQATYRLSPSAWPL